MNLPRRPKHLPKVQALAAIGQCKLLALWDQLFGNLGQTIAQVLLTRNDIADRTQYQNAQNTFIELLSMGVIPIVNENDTLAVTEIKFGDNDTLSAITAGMVQADYLFLMTDVDCLYDKNPRTNPDAQAIEVVEDITQLTADVNSAGSALGTGGMSTKIVAARLATSAGVTTVITKSSKPGNISAIIAHAEQARKAEASNRNSMSHGHEGNHHNLSTSTSSLPEPQAQSTTTTSITMNGAGARAHTTKPSRRVDYTELGKKLKRKRDSIAHEAAQLSEPRRRARVCVSLECVLTYLYAFRQQQHYPHLPAVIMLAKSWLADFASYPLLRYTLWQLVGVCHETWFQGAAAAATRSPTRPGATRADLG